MATKKKRVGGHRVLLLLRTSLLASVLTLEVPLPAVLAAFSLRSFFLHVCYNHNQKIILTSMGFEPPTTARFGNKQSPN